MSPQDVDGIESHRDLTNNVNNKKQKDTYRI